MNKKPNLAIVGATGLVGSTFLKVLEEKDFPNKFFGDYKCAYRDELGIVYPPLNR